MVAQTGTSIDCQVCTPDCECALAGFGLMPTGRFATRIYGAHGPAPGALLKVLLLDSSLLHEVANALLEIVDAVAHLVDAPNDRLRHLAESRLLPAQKSFHQEFHQSA